MVRGSKAGPYRLSKNPVIRSGKPEPTEIPAVQTQDLLAVYPRNSRELLVCWSVDWPKAFAFNPPVDRQAHVRIHSGTSKNRVQAVEPMRGSCLLGDLSPGQTYEVELGFYAPAGRWNVVVGATRTTMPTDSAKWEDSVSLVTLPWHLSFDRMQRLLGIVDSGELADSLLQLQRDALAQLLDTEKEKLLLALGLSAHDLERMEKQRQDLVARPQVNHQTEVGIGSSW